MKKKLVWRFKHPPTVENVTELTNCGILKTDEAKEICFKEEDDKGADVSALKEEIKFLRQLVEKLSDNGTIINTIHTIEKPYKVYPWYDGYYSWTNCAGGSITSDCFANSCTASCGNNSITNVKTFN